MANRFVNYVIYSHIDEVWNGTLDFWNNKNGKIRDQFISRNTLYRTLDVRRGMSVHPYGTSTGQTYEMTFAYHPHEKITYVNISIKFSNFGKGFPWLVPKKLIEKWAYRMGINPMKLARNQDLGFVGKFEEIRNIATG